MYLARRLSLQRAFVLRANEGPSHVVTATIEDNKKKLQTYKTLVNSRKLWEKSVLEDNKYAFVPRRAMRDVQPPKRKAAPRHLADFEAPEQHAENVMTKYTQPWRKALNNDTDAPLADDEEEQIWASPEELMPVSEEADPLQVDDDDEYSEGGDEEEKEEGAEVVEESVGKKTAAKLQALREQIYLERYGPNAKRPDPLPEDASEEDKKIYAMLREDEAKLDRIDGLHKLSHTSDSNAMKEIKLADELNDEMLAEASDGEEEDADEQDDAENDEDDDGLRCLLCGINAPKLHPMNVYLLSRFLSPHGDIIPKKITGTCLRHQRDISRTYRLSKQLGVLTFKKGFFIHNPYEPIPEAFISPDRIEVNQDGSHAMEAAQAALGEEMEADDVMEAEEDEEREVVLDERAEIDEVFDENTTEDLPHPILGSGGRTSKNPREAREDRPAPPRPVQKSRSRGPSQGQDENARKVVEKQEWTRRSLGGEGRTGAKVGKGREVTGSGSAAASRRQGWEKPSPAHR